METYQQYLSTPGGILFFILMIPISGFIIGALVAAVFRLSPATHPFWVFVLEVGGALLVLAVVRHRRRTTGFSRLR